MPKNRQWLLDCVEHDGSSDYNDGLDGYLSYGIEDFGGPVILTVRFHDAERDEVSEGRWILTYIP